jgi:hypothetical protein
MEIFFQEICMIQRPIPPMNIAHAVVSASLSAGSDEPCIKYALIINGDLKVSRSQEKI